MLQAFLHNPRPEPYLLGVSGGAAVGAVVAFALGAIGEAAITLAAFGGSVIAVFVTLAVGRTGGRATRGGPRTLLLCGGNLGAVAQGGITGALAAAAPDLICGAPWRE